ncbi:MAG: hypothetical protein KIT45_07915 [Fimbriimonadia bacterium]|nr:hypothetical protein [Fimbriimonadia bacterium]
MPLIEGRITGLTPQIATQLEQSITTAVRDALADGFPDELGFVQGTQEFNIAKQIAQKIMPGWTWVTLEEANWAIGGNRINNGIVARFNILVLTGAVEEQYKEAILDAVTQTVTNILGAGGQQVHLAISVVEGDVEMTLPASLFSGLTQGASGALLTPDRVRAFLMTEVVNTLRQQKAA